MGALTENEIFNSLEENFRKAAEYCVDLAVMPIKGPTYINLRETLKLLEGACRQAGHWREDSRWFTHGFNVAKCHKLAGDCLRDYKSQKAKYTFFMTLAKAMVNFHNQALILRHAKTGKVGQILPQALPVYREHTPKSMSGLILPKDMIHTSAGSA